MRSMVADCYRSVWKPLSNPVDEWPLAVCDGTTVSRDDLIETDSIRQGNVSTHYYVRHNPDQKWYFLDRQTPDEALIFKHFDTKPGIEAPCTLCESSSHAPGQRKDVYGADPFFFFFWPDAVHSSIKQLWPVENPRPRRSIEVRTLIFSAEVDTAKAA